MNRPDIAILISTFARPAHLQRALASLALQRGVEGRFEVVVTDDGSGEETRRVVAAFAQGVEFPVRFTTHEHQGFRLARCRNEGTAVSTAPYLLFTDGDCLLPADHLQQHLNRRRAQQVMAGDCFRLDAGASERVTEAAIRCGDYLGWVPAAERRRIAGKAFRARLYEFFHHPARPRLSGNNIGLWRSDFECVNGFDEHYVGWGLEDRDLQRRLRRAGVRCRSILPHTVLCHLWHAPDLSYSRNNAGTANLAYFRRLPVLLRCPVGLAERLRGRRLTERIGRLEHTFFFEDEAGVVTDTRTSVDRQGRDGALVLPANAGSAQDA